MDQYLKTTYYFDHEEESIQSLINDLKTAKYTSRERAILIYEKVRDEWLYDPYTISLSKDNYKSSEIAERASGNCVEKSVLLISCLRALGIPARLHLGKVKNHLAVDRLMEKFGTNELTPHGMVNVYLNDQWLKMSPAFNSSLCKRFNVEPLSFDGITNSYLQQYNSEGSKFMEYTADYGFFEDVPVEFMVQNIKENYPHIFDQDDSITEYKL